MEQKDELLGCFICYPTLYAGASETQKELAKQQGDLFKSYIYGENGISPMLKTVKNHKYGNDMLLILFEFYLNPIPYLLQNLKEIENYSKNEKSIGIPIVVTDENFFNKPEERHLFLKQSIFKKLELLAEVVKKKKLDTNMGLLKWDLEELLDGY